VSSTDEPRDKELKELRARLAAAQKQRAALEKEHEKLQREYARLRSRPVAARRARATSGSGAETESGWKPQELDAAALRAIIDRTKELLAPDEHQQLKAVVEAFVHITRQLEMTTVTLARLRRFLFGTSEKTSKVLGDEKSGPASDAAAGEESIAPAGEESIAPAGEAAQDEPEPALPAPEKQDRKKAPGHGRLSAAAYTGAKKIRVPQTTHAHGDRCPGCQKGKVYSLKEPRALVRITGVAPLGGTVYECEQLRCNLCQEIFAAPPPEGVGSKKYDESATSMIALAKYGIGMPFNRIEKLQHEMGIPMPATTQWELVEAGAKELLPVHQELVRQGAAAELIHNDDTSMKIIELTPEQREQLLGEDAEGRTGVFTSSLVAQRPEGERIALYYTGPRHSGENVAQLLAKRAEALPPPMQMCDALAANSAGEFETILANCLAHGRRYFVDAAANFPAESRFVLETLRDVYRHDAQAKEQKLSPDERLRSHQKLSGPLMKGLEQWLNQQLEEQLVEPNSPLGEAVRYMKKHWERLTLFLRKAGAPLDNNICERALKKAILHRKNALFYRTLKGAAVGDLYMGLIHTCELNRVGSFEYLVALLRHHEEAAKKPAEWMPWNYRDALKQVDARSNTPD
jgi:hypothetical protein